MKWKCPSCGSEPGEHGKGGEASCKEQSFSSCMGFICECEDLDTSDDHGESYDDTCKNAVCYHCSWSGEFPTPKLVVKKLTGWQKKAYENGWKPPKGFKQ